MVAQPRPTLLEVVERRCDQLVTGLPLLSRGSGDGEAPMLSSRAKTDVRGTAALISAFCDLHEGDSRMNAVIYLVGLVVVIMFILSFVGLR
jgi:hypothetical protein